LDIRACKIKKFPTALNNLKSLSSVTIYKSKLRRLRIDFAKNETIQRLDLSHNKFRTIPKGLEHFTALRYFNVTDNRIHRVSNRINNCAKLDKINLSYNRVRGGVKFTDNTNIKSVILSHSKLSSIPATLIKLPNLLQLDLSHNNLTGIPSRLKFNNLEILSLYGNKLDSIPNSILSSRKLRKLDLGFNKIKAINSTIGELDKLEFLSIPNNELGMMPEEMGVLSKLEFLYLRAIDWKRCRKVCQRYLSKKFILSSII
jgi:Leucine-rich repeat (LRR) protein